jgi:MarR family transcriptional regulator, 2-MHQ and catechol-resistance regulon repressor
MKKTAPDPVHAWLVMMKAFRAIGDYALEDIERAGLGDSDFRVLEVLLHKGPLPVNTIGPIVNLTPGSISVAVDRLHNKGLVTRLECREDRRIRTVSLTEKGEQLIGPLFDRHALAMRKVFSALTAQELVTFEALLKKVGYRAVEVSQACASAS